MYFQAGKVARAETDLVEEVEVVVEAIMGLDINV